jgi:hypothetical protein
VSWLVDSEIGCLISNTAGRLPVPTGILRSLCFRGVTLLRTFPVVLLLGAAALAGLGGCSALRVDRAVLVATSLTSHQLCSSRFVAGLDADRAFAELVEPLPGMGLVNWGLRYRVDPEARTVSASVAGMFQSKAVYRERLGCMVQHGEAPADPPGRLPGPALQPAVAAQLPEIAGPAPVAAADPRLEATLARAFIEADAPGFHRTKAVLVLRDGQVLAERYADGYGIDTPLLGFSMTKSVVHALVGILVRQGRLRLDQPAPVPAWQGAGDPRGAITIDQLLRQTSGLDLLQNNSGFDSSTQIMYLARDKAGASAAAPLDAPPGTRWRYTDTNYMLLSRIVRDAVGGTAGDVIAFAQRELFGPLGMNRAMVEFDATGTPMGPASMFASARDWARFGQLYLNDGMAGGQRILPQGWAAHAATPTLDTGYGAGFWTNRVPGVVPGWGAPWGLPNAPQDAFFARGFMGQSVVVIPSERLVLVRLSRSNIRWDDIVETNRWVGDVLEALRSSSS